MAKAPNWGHVGSVWLAGLSDGCTSGQEWDVQIVIYRVLLAMELRTLSAIFG